MEQWKEYKIEDICEQIFAGGDAAKYNSSKHQTALYNIPIYANSTEKEGLYGYCDKAIVLSPAVTIAARGAGIGFVAFRNKPFVPIVRLITLITNNSVDTKFLYYYLKNRRLSGDGSAIPQITVPMVKKEVVTIPALEEQKRIADILSSLDAKIELNRRINDNLEQQAQALFKSWFVDFEPFKDGKFVDSEMGMIPEGWKVVQLGDVTIQMKDRVGERSDVKVLSPVSTGELLLSEEYFTKQVYSEDISKYILVKPNMFAYNPARVNIGSIGRNKNNFDGCVSPVYVVFSCEENYHYFFDLFRMLPSFKEEVALRAIGGVRQTLKYSDLSMIKTIYPPLYIVLEFNKIMEKLLNIQKMTSMEILNLAEIRDTLLPRLMSGELKINDLNC